MIQLRSLRHLVVLSRRLNFVRAADELGITQPALTRSIQALEQQLAVTLFDRSRGGVSLTPQGRLIAGRARVLLMDADQLESQARMLGEGESGRIRFGMAPMPAHALLDTLLKERLTHFPNVGNDVFVRDVEALWTMLFDGEIEFFVSPNRPLHDLSQVRSELLATLPLSVIVRADHPLIADRSSSARFPLLRSSWTGMSVPREIAGNLLGNANVVEDYAVLARLTATTDALWLGSSFAVRGEIAEGSLVELVRAEQPLELVIYALERSSRSPLAESLIDSIRALIETSR